MHSHNKIRYAVVGLGHIAQNAVLPAFSNAATNSELAALVSSDATKLKELADLYGVHHTYDYDHYDECLRSGNIDAVYIALPNHLHREYTERAARAGIHVLCEKPMAITEDDCLAMIRTCEENHVKLMIAYRLHFEEANLRAVELARSGDLGDVRLFNSVFSMQVAKENIRTDREKGGGPLYDIGIYCINAARYIMQDEPTELMAYTASDGDRRFTEVEETVSASLRFPGERIANFVCTFNAWNTASYDVLGTKATLHVENAYEYETEMRHYLTEGEKTREDIFPVRDQFGPEIVYFSDCILNDKQPEPNGWEGLADIRIIRAIFESAKTGRSVILPDFEKRLRPTLAQEIYKPIVEHPHLVHAAAPSQS